MRCFAEVAIGPFSATLGSVGCQTPDLFLAAFVPERLDQQFHAILRVPEGGPSAISNTS